LCIVSSSTVIKVDFDFAMTIPAHNLYRLFAYNLSGYSNQTDLTLFEKFLFNSGEVVIDDDVIRVNLKKKRHLPLVLTAMEQFEHNTVPWSGNRRLIFSSLATS